MFAFSKVGNSVLEIYVPVSETELVKTETGSTGKPRTSAIPRIREDATLRMERGHANQASVNPIQKD
jgi:hypothetical protein